MNVGPEQGSALTTSAIQWRDLSPLLRPRRIGVVGVSEHRARGNGVVRNLIRLGYAGDVYPINPKYREFMGLRCYPELAAVPAVPDAVVVAIPAAGVPALLSSALDLGIQAAVVLSSGFAEAGPEGQARQAELERLGAERGLLLCGPNCFGLCNLITRAVMFSVDPPQPFRTGEVAVVSQSGGHTGRIATPLMAGRGLGCSHLISCGDQACVSVEEYLNYLVDDPDTGVIAAYVEEFRRPDLLPAVAAKALARAKPILVMHTGQSAIGRQATMAHTGSRAGDPEVLAAALRRFGIVQVHSIGELIETVALFASPLREQFGGGSRIAMVSGSGGECCCFADAAASRGLEFAQLTPQTREQIRQLLPPFGTAQNPLDGTGGLSDNPALFPRLLETLLRDPEPDLFMLNLEVGPPEPDGTLSRGANFAQPVLELAPRVQRPIVAFSANPAGVWDVETLAALRTVAVPFIAGAEVALDAIQNLRHHIAFRRRVQTAAAPVPDAPALLASDLKAGVLDPAISWDLLRAFGISGAPPAAAKQSRPQWSPLDPAQMGTGVPLVLRVDRDRVFGLAVSCRLGGSLAAVLTEAALDLAPLSATAAGEMLRCWRGWPLLAGGNDQPPADVDALCQLLADLSRLSRALSSRLERVEISPVILCPRGQGLRVTGALIELRADPITTTRL